jgi:hypothetical protein
MPARIERARAAADRFAAAVAAATEPIRSLYKGHSGGHTSPVSHMPFRKICRRDPRGMMRMIRGGTALVCFVLGTLVAPALHLADHGRDHVHTAQGVIYSDGHRDDGPGSIDEILSEIRSVAFSTQDEAGGESGPQFRSRRNENDVHGSGALLHFATMYQRSNPFVAIHCNVRLLAEVVARAPFIWSAPQTPETQHIRGPPTFA